MPKQKTLGNMSKRDCFGFPLKLVLEQAQTIGSSVINELKNIFIIFFRQH
jgi:hypothetical protein